MCMYVCVCMYVCMCMDVCACMYVYVCMCMYVCACMYVHVCMCMYVYVCMHMYVCMCMLYTVKNSCNWESQVFESTPINEKHSCACEHSLGALAVCNPEALQNFLWGVFVPITEPVCTKMAHDSISTLEPVCYICVCARSYTFIH